MKTTLFVFAILFAFILLVNVIPESDAFKDLIDFDFDIDKKFKKKLAKKLIAYFLLAGNKKIYTVPIPLPIPIP